ncbi:hypothetical protein LTR02_002347 [Friedmanniomyces endolithicus]|nr:hypothetical protein LTR59_013392 [Friedmanniomyces endolithicus]KAK0798876.1 hypothetical protein LTR38_007682 [Friedmanniomyces endolithicus]KAK0805767.1 hypothetical protein LTR75_007229 [Friedmanniomyces endolithicus]KAK0849965.1 hypothetical protein LTR03_004926 [Friedmanniomyces endolithicus]KAK0863485.1 hypothetical protein LTS02_006561 [Friedmanniomyces endolithicus]
MSSTSPNQPAPKKYTWNPLYDTPRDLIGHGPNPPHPHWPNNAKIALSFVINYEEGGEYSVLNGDAKSESYLTEASGAAPRHESRNTNVESEYDFGARAGIWRLLRIFEQAGLHGTIYGVGLALEKNPAVAKECQRLGWEIASHGWRWIDYHSVPESQERAEINRCIDLITAQTGQAPRERGLELLWLSDSYADDLPYYHPVPVGLHKTTTTNNNTNDNDHVPEPSSSSSPRPQPSLILPYSLDTNDFKFLMPNNWSSPDDFLHYLIAAFDELYAEGEAGSPKMMSVGLHARISGRAGRAGVVRRFVEYVGGKEGVWIATREEIARCWVGMHPWRGEGEGEG